MSNKIPTLKEYRRILSIANTNPTLATTLSSLRNAWLLCDTEYVSTHSELSEINDELTKLERRYKELKNKRYSLESKVEDMDAAASKASRELTQKSNTSDLLNKIKATYSINNGRQHAVNKYAEFIDLEEDEECGDQDPESDI